MNKPSVKIVRENHDGAQVLNYKDRPSNLNNVLRSSVEKYPDKIAFECHSASATYAEFAASVECLAASMQSTLGIEKGDRVALVLGNDYFFPLVFFAAARIGAVSVPINTRLVSKEISFILKNSGARAIFVDPPYHAECVRATANAQSIKHTVLTEKVPEASDTLYLEDLMKQSPGWTGDVEVLENDLASIFYTAGTTGIPRGAMCTHRNFIANAMNTSLAIGTTPEEKGLICLPLCHPTACHSQMIYGVYNGTSNVILRRFNADETLSKIESARITTFVGVPTVYWLLLTQMKLKDYDLSSLENIVYGGAPTSPELVRRLRETFPSVRLGNGYGLSESSSLATFLPDEYAMEKPDSVGPPVQTVELRIVDDNGQNLLPGKIGEVLLKGPNVVAGYWRDSAATRDVFRNGWCHTGDLGRIDDEGFLHIVDRKKDMIIRGGENIYCVEIENVLASHPCVFAAAAVGKPDKVFGEQVVAYIVPAIGTSPTEDEILDYCDDLLADFKVPKFIKFVNDLPRNPAGKIDKNALRP
jgi:long-chain acyl-CoA synthetase